MCKTYFLIFSITFLFFSCSKNNNNSYHVIRKIENKKEVDTQFTIISPSESQIHFQNNIEESLYFNFLNYAYIYNGGGVAIGDFNNDGLADIYFSANQTSNKLYLNEGDFKFKDITKSAGVSDEKGWTTGVSIIDINQDGWLDIYVCKSGSLRDNKLRENKLFINQKDNTFKESAAQWKLNDPGFGTQAYFLDLDKDGDLDMYLVNHRADFQNNTVINPQIQKQFSKYDSDKLYRNDGSFFTDITQQAGVMNKAWGLSASIGDFNQDGWDDIYVCNDFLEPDFLYINDQHGHFKDEILTKMKHISQNSMGSDFADINNDLLPDLLVLEMAAEDHIRSKSNMPSMSTENFQQIVNSGYHHQYMSNTLQLNHTHNHFSEIALLAGVAKTDWSWSPLLADLDNDGLKDIFITNGILKELSNQDYRQKIKKRIQSGVKMTLEEARNMMPSSKLSNYCFQNQGDLQFKKVAQKWGLDAKTQSNGVAYADLDNDGDLDLVINNINDVAQIYKNNDTHHFIQLRLKGNDENPFAIGAKATIKTNKKVQTQSLYQSRGYLSAVQNILNFGIGNESRIHTLKIDWNNGKETILTNIDVNQIIEINPFSARKKLIPQVPNPFLKPINSSKIGIDFKHQEKNVNDFKNQVLLPHSESRNGPFFSKGDINGDGLEDFFIGGAAGQSGQIYFQNQKHHFVKKDCIDLENDQKYEDLGSIFFDADGDKDLDLYVVSGSSEFPANSDRYQDRLYLNDGKGNFKKSDNLPKITTSGQVVKASDIDHDGDLDLFIGGRTIPDKYPFPPQSIILINENGKFADKTKQIAPDLTHIGMITDASFSDFDQDGDEDLIVVGEWMPITIFENKKGKLIQKKLPSLDKTTGLWFSLAAKDLDNDGDLDFLVGNLGLNSKYKSNSKKTFQIYCDDFDQSGTYDIVLTSNYHGALVPARGKECSSQQMPFIAKKFPTYQSFAKAKLVDVYGQKNLDKALHYKADILESIYLENLGNGDFEIHKLPIEAQFSPIMDFGFKDLDGDQKDEILLVGNHYDTEVETVRYDASFGTVLSFIDGGFYVIPSAKSGFVVDGNAKCILVIGDGVLVGRNDGFLKYVY